MKKYKVGIIGAGIFGLTAALELSKNFDVTVFDKSDEILSGASTNNHLRHHIGYHYPRSHDTVQLIKDATESFEEVYSDCLVGDFPAYYAVSKKNSMTDAQQFIEFCERESLPYKEGYPDDGRILIKDSVSICVITPEKVCDIDLLSKQLQKSIAEQPSITLKLGTKVVGGRLEDSKKILISKKGESETSEEFDILVNVTYSNYNLFNDWFGLPKRKMQYELLELLEIKLPHVKKFGITVMDGEFTSILPRGNKETYTLGHVDSSVLKREICFDLPDELTADQEEIKSNREKIIKQSLDFVPIVKDAEVVRSLYVTRVVKPDHEHDDARPSEIIENGKGFYSIFGGKLITSVKIARELANMLKEVLI